MEDGEGRYIDFRNTLIILTTNVLTDCAAEGVRAARARCWLAWYVVPYCL